MESVLRGSKKLRLPGAQCSSLFLNRSLFEWSEWIVRKTIVCGLGMEAILTEFLLGRGKKDTWI